MAYYPATIFPQQFLSDSSVLLSGGTIEAYISGTSTPTNMFTDSSGTVAGTSITLNARGEPAVSGNTVNVWLDKLVDYKFVLKDASGVSKYTVDGISYPGATSITYSPADFAGVGDGVTNDTAAFTSLFSAERHIIIPPGTWLIDAIDVSEKVHVLCYGTLKLRTVPTHRKAVINFVAGSEGSTWTGGTIDGDRDAHSASHVKDTLEWFNMRLGADDVTVQMVEHKNSTWFALWGEADDLTAQGHRYVTCGAGARFESCDRVRAMNHVGVGFDNNGAAFNQHAFDMWYCDDSFFQDFATYDQDGDTDGTSSFASGITAVECHRSKFWGMTASRMVPDDLIHVALTFVGLGDCDLRGLSAYSFAGTGLEINGLENCTIDGFQVDANYLDTSVKDQAATVGVDFNSGTFYPSNTARRSIVAAHGNQFSNGSVVRCGYGLFVRGFDNIFSHVRSEGNLVDGWRINEFQSAQFSGAQSNNPQATLSNCVGSFNGACGVAIDDVDTLRIVGGEYIGNGQDTALSNARRSAIGDFSGSTVSLVDIHGAKLRDTQNFTAADTVSFDVGSTDADNRYTFTILDPEKMPRMGQRVTLDNVVSTADASGKVVDVARDEFTVDFGAAKTFTSTGLLTSLTGTVSGASTTLTGTGTAFDTELTAAMWIKIGSEYRQVIAVASATSCTISSAFTTAPSGASVEKVTTDLVGIPSQHYGIYLTANVDEWFTKDNDYGNEDYLSEPFRLVNLSAARVGSEYLLGALAASFTAASNRHPLLEGIPSGHRVIGARCKLNTNWTGASTLALQAREQGGSLVTEIFTLSGVTAASKNTQSAVPTRITAISNINLESGANPSAGTAKVEALIRVDGMPQYA